MPDSKLKLYYHYKNKPYKLLGEARHSETLQELVLYKTRYENDLGSLWVRPKEMFYEEIEHEGERRPRFHRAEIRVEESTNITPKDQNEILQLLGEVFGGYSQEKFEATITHRNQIYLLKAHYNDKLIGFKLGYTYNKERFYSWLGAVAPEYRGIGLGKELLIKQHDWCIKQGFRVIETRTKNKWREMLLLNISSGFNIVATYTNSKGQTKIILEKELKVRGSKPV